MSFLTIRGIHSLIYASAVPSLTSVMCPEDTAYQRHSANAHDLFNPTTFGSLISSTLCLIFLAFTPVFVSRIYWTVTVTVGLGPVVPQELLTL